MKAIIVAAGMGRRLSPFTDDRPKGLVQVGKKPILRHQLDAYRSVGVQEFVIVRGYRADVLTATLSDEPGVGFVDNLDFPRNNILLSMMCAADHMDGGFWFSYADIVFRPEVVAAMQRASGDILLAVDPYWATAYDGRTDHPVAEAELAHVEDGVVRAVGKRVVPAEQARGEFIGLLRVSAAGADKLRGRYRQQLAALGLQAPYGRAPRLEVAYLTDLLNDLIAQGEVLRAVDLPGRDHWREIDTVQDLARAHAVVSW